MTRKLRPKTISKQEFQSIMKRNWVPVELTFDALPGWMKGIPESQRAYVYASGSSIGVADPKQATAIVGGVDVFRDGKGHGDPVNWNKDHYIIVKDPNNDEYLLTYGPLKDSEHWIDDIPKRLKGAEVLIYENKTGSSA